MIDALLAKIFGTKHERAIKKMQPLIAAINEREPEMEKLEDHELAAKTAEFKQRLEQGEPLDDLIPDAFAVVREAGRRTVNMRHFDVGVGDEIV